MTRKQISLRLVDKNMRRNKEVYIYLASFSNISPSPVFELKFCQSTVRFVEINNHRGERHTSIMRLNVIQNYQ